MAATHPDRLPPITFSERHRVTATLVVLGYLVVLAATTGTFIGTLIAGVVNAVLNQPVFTNAGP